MISRDALYSFVETLITAAGVGTPLENAESFRSLRASVDEADKVIRVNCWSGRFSLTETPREEQDVDFIIECFVTPASQELEDLDTAIDLSFDMAKTIFKAMAPNGIPDVCQAYGDDFESDIANLGTIRRGATYLFGKIN